MLRDHNMALGLLVEFKRRAYADGNKREWLRAGSHIEAILRVHVAAIERLTRVSLLSW